MTSNTFKSAGNLATPANGNLASYSTLGSANLDQLPSVCSEFRGTDFRGVKFRCKRLVVAQTIFSAWFLLWLFGSSFFAQALMAQVNATVTHVPSGMQFTGGVLEVKQFLNQGSKNDTRLISILDGPRRIIFPEKVSDVQQDARTAPRTFELGQNVVSNNTASIAAVGTTLQKLPFNQFGRRKVYVDTNKGAVWLLQGITELAPSFARVQGVKMEGEGLFEFPFDFRIATSTLPGDTLVAMLRNATNNLNDYQQRERIVEFLIEAERYGDAQRELNQLLVDFKQIDQERFDTIKTRLATTSARLVLRELDLRRDAGQFLTVENILESFDTQNLSPETLVDISSQRRNILDQKQQINAFKAKIDTDCQGYYSESNLEPESKARVESIQAEILRDLNANNVARLSTYELRSGDANITFESKIAFLISGWLLGAADAFENAPVVLSAIQSRELLRRYLVSENPIKRGEIIPQLKLIEAGTVRYYAPLARNILPWAETAKPEQGTQGFFRLKLDEIPGQPEYLVQLPPEYDPYKKYPCIVALCDSGSSPLFEVEWWDGKINPADGYRNGQASRHGYIVIAPDWRKPLDPSYNYDPYAANIVFSSLRKSLRMFSIDSDKVFLSGHAIGGEVAWDLGLAHPDMWAGVIPISAIADRYINYYDNNSRYHLPFYFVMGDQHNPPPRGMLGNYDKREDAFEHMALSIHYNFIVVTYIGRRSEHFLEEILNLFTWMKTQRRNFATPEHKFDVNTMREWDNFFWWFEMHDIPPRQVVSPIAWDFVTERKSLPIEASIVSTSNGNSNMRVTGGGESATFWLSPKWVNLDKEVLVGWNGKKTQQLVQPSRVVILEDLRRRSDTNNPFWARLTYDLGWNSSDEGE